MKTKHVTFILFIVFFYFAECERNYSPLSVDYSKLSLIKDPAIANCIREKLSLPQDHLLTIPELESITELVCYKNNIYSLDGIEYCSNLERLVITKLKTNDLSPLKSLEKVFQLTLKADNFNNLSPLVGLKRLTGISLTAKEPFDIAMLARIKTLRGVCLSPAPKDISPLGTLDKLIQLEFTGGVLPNLSPLSDTYPLDVLALFSIEIPDARNLLNVKRRLIWLEIQRSKFIDLSIIHEFRFLYGLKLPGNGIQDISPLKNNRSINVINLSDNKIRDITPLASVIALGIYFLDNNQINDILPLMDVLDENDYLNVRNNPLNERTINEYIPQLIERGVKVDY